MRPRVDVGGCLVLAFLALCAWSPVAAQTGKIQVEVIGADAEAKSVDACNGFTCNEQDFWAQVAFPPFTVWQKTSVIDNRDHAVWSPPYVASADVSKLQRFHDIHVELWDKDDNTWTSDDRFDISPLGHIELQIHFDACNNTWEEIGLSTMYGPGKSYPPFGTAYANQGHEFDGKVVLDVHTEGRIPFTTNDIAIVDLNPVQVAFDPEAVVSGKPTAMKVVLSSSYIGPTAPAPLTVTATDGISFWTETRSVVIPPGLSTFYFFDGMIAGSFPFVPIKPAYSDIAFLTYSANVVFNDLAPLGTPPDFIDCYQYNNSINGKQTPIVRTSAPDPVFVRWDWLDSNNVSSLPSVNVMANRDEHFRLQTWPLAQTSPMVLPSIMLTLWNPTNLIQLFSEPYYSLAALSTTAKLGGIERMILVPRNGWFKANHWRSPAWTTNSIGLSLGEFAPHAVIAEEGHYAVSTHEMGHTFTLSQRKCSHDDFNVGCRDEYNISASDGAPFLARGLDVMGTIFPAGSPTGPNDAVAGCPNAQPGTREVCRTNIMDRQNDVGWVNWTDTFTQNFLTGLLKNQADPEIVNLSGWVHTLNGWNPNQAPSFEGSLDFSYHAFGVPDLEDPLTTVPPSPASGKGSFSVHLTTSHGDHVYRFTPPFITENDEQPRERAYFSFFVPWDPEVMRVALYGPADIRNTCEGGTCSDVLLFERFIQPTTPVIVALAAGQDEAPSLGGATTPIPSIGSGHDVVIAWSAIDGRIGATGGSSATGASGATVPGIESAGTPAHPPAPASPGTGNLRAVLLLKRAGTVGGPGGPATGAAEPWLPFTFDDPGSEVRIPFSALAEAPGDYVGQLIVSNGLLSSTYVSGTLFHVLQGGNCQVDPTPGAPCDDGDACTQNDMCVPDPFAGIVCRGTPTDCNDHDNCTADSCNPTGVCVVPDDGSGTANLPPQGCGYSALEPLKIISGLPPGATIDIAAVHKNFTCPAASVVCSFAPPVPASDCDQAGGTLGGEESCAASTLAMQMTGTGAMSGFSRTINLSAGSEFHAAPRTPGDPVQSFDSDLFRFYGQITNLDNDPDFDLLRIVAGDDFGLPSPGHTTLTKNAAGDWEVDSFIDTTYRIDYVGKMGGALAGRSGSTTGTVRFRTGGGACTHAPVVCDDGNPCTADSCDPATGACRFVPTPNAPCSDGDLCTQGDLCVQGPAGGITCQGTPAVCGDGDVCTNDTCDPGTGLCAHSPVVCDDQNVCTSDSCNPVTGGCQFVPIPMSEPIPINWSSPGNFSWLASPGATQWNVYRGTIPGGMQGSRPPAGPLYDQVCFESADAHGDGATIAADPAIPPIGRAYYYLISAEGPCGESALGHATSGAAIPNTSPCPTPP